MYCSKCGVENSDQADYCKGCGAALHSRWDWGRENRYSPSDNGSPFLGIIFALIVCAMVFSGVVRLTGFPWGFPWIPGVVLTPLLIVALIFLAIFMSRR